jgi:hypothetical protein
MKAGRMDARQNGNMPQFPYCCFFESNKGTNTAIED